MIKSSLEIEKDVFLLLKTELTKTVDEVEEFLG